MNKELSKPARKVLEKALVVAVLALAYAIVQYIFPSVLSILGLV